MKKLFGTDGIRGEAGKFPLDAATVFVIGQSLARQFQQTGAPKFIIGRDTRESGTWLAAAFCAGAASVGADCVSAGIITTPGVAFLTKMQRADAGIVISASHNPSPDNGIKIFAPTGKKISAEIERQIEADIAAADLTTHADHQSPNDEQAAELQNLYLDYLKKEFANLSLANLKIVADCANGAAFDLAPRLLRDLGADVTAIFNDPDGRNINDGCGSLHIEKLQAEVLERKADFGVAFDGDADRALFVDEAGNLVDGDATLWAMAQHLQNRGELRKETVVATSMSNLGLELALKNRSIKLVRTDVGDKYVLAELLKSETALGGEQSGHIIFPFRSLVGDGMLTALEMLEAMQHNRAKLSELTAGFVRFPQVLLNVKVREKTAFDTIAPLAAAVREVETEMGDKGRLVLRYSGTESLARVMIEGEKQEIINAQAHRLAAVIAREIG